MNIKKSLVLLFLCALILTNCAEKETVENEKAKTETQSAQVSKDSETNRDTNTGGSFEAKFGGFENFETNGSGKDVKDMSFRGVFKSAEFYLCSPGVTCISILVPYKDDKIVEGEYEVADTNVNEAKLEAKPAAAVSGRAKKGGDVVRWNVKSGRINVTNSTENSIEGTFNLSGSAEEMKVDPKKGTFTVEGTFTIPLKEQI